MTPLWAPWRMEYIQACDRPDGCVFCDMPGEGPESHERNLILACDERAFVVMNRYPYANGHLLVVPRAHAATLEALAAPSFDALWKLVRTSVAALGEALGPAGLNLGMNFGRSAGAGVADHLHVHLVPRWEGDTNFMPVVAGVRVMPEHLAATYRKLRGPFERLAGGARGAGAEAGVP